jgi:hypothetical protein
MIRLTDEQWERIRNHFPEEHVAMSLLRAASVEQEPRSRRDRNQDARNAQARRALTGAGGNDRSPNLPEDGD